MMNNTFYASNDYRLYIEHHGIKGQKWGVRRFQNADGSYTSAGKGRYGIGDDKPYKNLGGKIKAAAGKAAKAAWKSQVNYAKRAEIEQNRGVEKANAYWEQLRNSKGAKEKLSAAIGTKRNEAMARVDAKTERELAKHSTFSFDRDQHNANAANYEAEANYQRKLSTMTGKQRVAEAITRKEYMKTPYTKLDGTVITRGRKMQEDAINELANIALNAIIDAGVDSYKKRRESSNE